MVLTSQMYSLNLEYVVIISFYIFVCKYMYYF